MHTHTHTRTNVIEYVSRIRCIYINMINVSGYKSNEINVLIDNVAINKSQLFRSIFFLSLFVLIRL